MIVKVFIGLVALVFGGLTVEHFVFDDVHLNGPKEGLIRDGKCKSDKNPVFKAELTDRSKILYIKPLGNTQSVSAARSSIVIKEGSEVPVYNPTDATLETISEKNGKYSLLLQTSCEVTFLFDRLDKISETITPKALVKKGGLLGYVKGTAQGSSFDLLVSNSSKQVPHINSKRWQEKEALYADCPYEYFDNRNDNNLKRDYTAYTLVHNENIIQKVWNKEQGYSNISCGEISHDIKGTASGGWFKGDSTDIKGDYLSVNKYLSTVQVSIKKDGQLTEALTDYSPDVLAADIKPGNSACYHDQNQNKWVYVKVISDNQLALTKGAGNCPANFPQEQAGIWER